MTERASGSARTATSSEPGGSTSLEFAGVVRRGEFVLDAQLLAGAGEVVALLGPNGAGKSTMLRAIAGLVGLDGGTIRLAGDLLDDPAGGTFVAARDRGIGVVFQDHRLFPHLNVLDNVAFGPRAHGATMSAARASAAAWLDRLGLSELAARHPRRLSGGQAQRVAVARALASEPRLLLMDEPLAALDVQTRAEVQGELRRHLSSFGGATVLVTHDPIEALLLAHRLMVLEQGRVVQAGSPTEVTTRPLTPYVASLVGMNLFLGRAAGREVFVDGGGSVVTAETVHGQVCAALRPSAITVHTQAPTASSARNLWPARVTGLAPLGDRVRVRATGDLGFTVDVTAAAVAELRLAIDLPVWLSAKAVDVSVYPAPTSAFTVAG